MPAPTPHPTPQGSFPINRRILRGYGPLAVFAAMLVLMAMLVPTTVPKQEVSASSAGRLTAGPASAPRRVVRPPRAARPWHARNHPRRRHRPGRSRRWRRWRRWRRGRRWPGQRRGTRGRRPALRRPSPADPGRPVLPALRGLGRRQQRRRHRQGRHR